MPEPNVESSATGDSDAIVIALSGEIDLDSAPHAFEAVAAAIQAGHRRIVLDMSGVEYMDSSGLTELVVAARQAELAAARLEIRAPSKPVRDVLSMTGLEVLFLPRGDPS